MAPFILSWGIIGTGWIATKFANDLAIQHDGFTDVLHAVVAVGSRSLSRSQQFIEDNLPRGAVAQQKGLVEELPVACGAYEEVYNHKGCDIIYIATLHPSHYTDARDALLAGKHCLIEKPATLNAAEWRSLTALAKERSLFLMEGMWTRFLPIMEPLTRVLLKENLIGEIRQVNATFAMCHDKTAPTHRLLDPGAAGGALLDLGAYTILPSLIGLYHNPKNAGEPPQVKATLVRGITGVDIIANTVLAFPKMQAIGIGTASFAANSPREEKCIISGTKGEIVIHDGLSRITRFSLRKVATDNALPFLPTKWDDDVHYDTITVGFGLVYEANSVARSIRDGQVENSTWSHKDTALVMEILAEVRRQNDYELQAGLEQVQ